MFRVYTLTTADNTMEVGFGSTGTIIVEGTFGSGTVNLFPIGKDQQDNRVVGTTSVKAITTGGTPESITTGRYLLSLDGSTGATIRLFIIEEAMKGF